MSVPTRTSLLADKVLRYWELTRLVADARHVMAPLHDELVRAICEDGEPIDVEGLPTLRVVERRSGRLWDVKALATQEPREFQRLLSENAEVRCRLQRVLKVRHSPLERLDNQGRVG